METGNQTPYYYDPRFQKPKTNGFAIASLVIGIISMLCCYFWYFSGFFGIVGLVMGLVAILGENKNQKGIAIAGIATSSVGLFLAAIMLVVTILKAVGTTTELPVNDYDMYMEPSEDGFTGMIFKTTKFLGGFLNG